MYATFAPRLCLPWGMQCTMCHAFHWESMGKCDMQNWQSEVHGVTASVFATCFTSSSLKKPGIVRFVERIHFLQLNSLVLFSVYFVYLGWSWVRWAHLVQIHHYEHACRVFRFGTTHGYGFSGPMVMGSVGPLLWTRTHYFGPMIWTMHVQGTQPLPMSTGSRNISPMGLMGPSFQTHPFKHACPVFRTGTRPEPMAMGSVNTFIFTV